MAVNLLEHQASRKVRHTYSKAVTGTIAVGDTFKLTMSGQGHGSILLRHIRVSASGGTATTVTPAAYLDAARTASGKVWAGTWVGASGLIFAAGEGAGQVLPLDADGSIWIDPGLDNSAGAVTVAITFEVM